MATLSHSRVEEKSQDAKISPDVHEYESQVRIEIICDDANHKLLLNRPTYRIRRQSGSVRWHCRARGPDLKSRWKFSLL